MQSSQQVLYYNRIVTFMVEVIWSTFIKLDYRNVSSIHGYYNLWKFPLTFESFHHFPEPVTMWYMNILIEEVIDDSITGVGHYFSNSWLSQSKQFCKCSVLWIVANLQIVTATLVSTLTASLKFVSSQSI